VPILQDRQPRQGIPVEAHVKAPQVAGYLPHLRDVPTWWSKLCLKRSQRASIAQTLVRHGRGDPEWRSRRHHANEGHL